MPRYEITAPDGGRYEINAPEGASEQDVLSFAQSQFAAPRQPPAQQPQTMPQQPQQNIAETAARSGFQGMTMGTGDEIVALGSATWQPVFLGDDGSTFGQRYDEALMRQRNALKKGREDNPITAYGSEAIGTIATSSLPMLNFARGGQYARAAGTGALQGALYGAGTAEGDVSNRLTGALTGGGTGAVLGGLSVPASKAVGNLAQSLMTGRQAKQLGMSKPSYEMMSRVLQADEAVTGQGLGNIREAGEAAMVVDAGPSARGVLDMVMQRGGKALTTASRNIGERVDDAATKLTRALDKSLGSPKGIKGAARNIAKRTSGARSDAYEKAYSSIIDYASPEGMKIEDVFSRIPARAIKQAVDAANDSMVSQGKRNMQIMANIADDGQVVFSEMPNIQQLDELKKALGNIGRESVDQFGRPTATGQMYSRLANELRDAMTDAAPSYREALDLGFDKIEMDQGLQLGREMLMPSVTREDVALGLKGMSQAAKNEAKIGLRSYIDDAMARVKMAVSDPNVDAREAMQAIKDLSSRASREKVSTLLGQEEAGKLFRVIDEAGKTFELRSGLARNSATFARQEANKLLNDLAKEGPLQQLRKGEVKEAAKKAIQSVTGMSEAKLQNLIDNNADELAQFLTGDRGENAINKLRMLADSMPVAQRAGERSQRLSQRLLTGPSAMTAGNIANRRDER